MKKYRIEICANSVQSALNAQLAGADRVELCDNLWESGTTPSYGTIKIAREKLDIVLFILIRPRGGDFVYSDLEFETMLEDIQLAKSMGADGIVSGVLCVDGSVDKERTERLIEISDPLPFTFHRAFDVTKNLSQSLEDLIDCGAHRVLTSGGRRSAFDGIEVLKALNDQSANRMKILAGGGINETNIKQLITTGCDEFHFTANEWHRSEFQSHTDLRLNGSDGIHEYDYKTSSVKKIRQVRDQLQH